MENSTTIYNSSSSTSSSAAALSLMENYPTIFNTSSSTSSASPFTLNMMMDSHASLTETHDKKPNGFLGLMTQMTMQVPRSSSTSSELFGKNNIISHATKSFADGVQTDHHEVQKDQKMKGEKKIKKSRYAFQTRSQVDILDDGYRWRKYGQKSVKNNNFPRSYYRCTHQGCNVKKQVQRLSKDEGIVVTTYEGMHSHPIEKSTDNFEHILNEMQIYTSS